jgi:hypothetical protein
MKAPVQPWCLFHGLYTDFIRMPYSLRQIALVYCTSTALRLSGGFDSRVLVTSRILV